MNHRCVFESENLEYFKTAINYIEGQVKILAKFQNLNTIFIQNFNEFFCFITKTLVQNSTAATG